MTPPLELLLGLLMCAEILAAVAVFGGAPESRVTTRKAVGIACLVAAYSAAFSLLSGTGTFPFAVVPWLGVFGVGIVSARLAYGCSWLEALVLATLGYCLNHLCSDALNVLVILDPALAGPGTRFGPTGLLVRYLFFVPAYALAYRLVGRSFATNSSKTHDRARWVVFCGGATMVAIVFQLAFIDGRPADVQLPLFVYDMLCTVLVMVAMVGLSRQDGLADTLTTIERLADEKRAQYELSQENIELINIKCHDIRKRIAEAGSRDAALSPQTVQEINDCVRVYDATAQTGSRALDVVITNAQLKCSEQGIELMCMADGSLLSAIAEDDLYFLMENVLSNAIEAAQRLDDPQRRVISLTVTKAGPMVRVYEENYYDGDLRFEGGLPQTTKPDTANHGFGTRSIRHIVDKYDGDLSMGAENGVFTVSILLPLA